MSIGLTWEDLADRVAALAELRGDWSGYPMPLDGARLRVSPGFPYQSANGLRVDNADYDNWEAARNRAEDALVLETFGEGAETVNSWITSTGQQVMVIRNAAGKIGHLTCPVGRPSKRLCFAINTLGAARAWRVEAELAAVARLKDLVTPVAYDYYLLTGSFLETSPRSNVTYFFRKNRPTVALRPCFDDGDMKIIAVLCLHPLGYYEDSWSGCMVPTDDLIAHLLLMRADERGFWAKANQHNVWEAGAGL